MNYIKSFKIFESIEIDLSELEDVFSSILNNIKIYKAPYSYYGLKPDLNFYFIVGFRNSFKISASAKSSKNDVHYSSPEDYDFLQELYHNHDILKNIFDLDFYNITLDKDKSIIVLHDKSKEKSRGEKYIPLDLSENVFRRIIPTEDYNFLKSSGSISYIKKAVSSAGYCLTRGIRYSNGNSSNLSLSDWIYKR